MNRYQVIHGDVSHFVECVSVTFLFWFEVRVEFRVCGHHAGPPGVSCHLGPDHIPDREGAEQRGLGGSFARDLRADAGLMERQESAMQGVSCGHTIYRWLY